MLGFGGVIGFAVGQHTYHCDCPKDLSTALKGCEYAAIEVNRQIFITQWTLDECNEKLIAANDLLMKIMISEATQRKNDE